MLGGGGGGSQKRKQKIESLGGIQKDGAGQTELYYPRIEVQARLLVKLSVLDMSYNHLIQLAFPQSLFKLDLSNFMW